MATINEITMTVAGNLVADHEIRHTATGRRVARFRIAQTAAANDTTGDPWKNDDMFTRQPEQPEF